MQGRGIQIDLLSKGEVIVFNLVIDLLVVVFEVHFINGHH